MPPLAGQPAKAVATTGIMLSLLQCYFACITLIGKRFLMWPSKIWNGQDTAVPRFAITGVRVPFFSLRPDGVTVAAS